MLYRAFLQIESAAIEQDHDYALYEVRRAMRLFIEGYPIQAHVYASNANRLLGYIISPALV